MAQMAKLDPEKVLADLATLADGRIPALLCFERPDDGRYCHRGFISVWLKESAGLDVFEHGLERLGAGRCHPKLPSSKLPPLAS